MIRQVRFTNVPAIHNRPLHFRFGGSGIIDLSPYSGFNGFDSNNCAARFENAINAALGAASVTVTASEENSGQDFLFHFDFVSDPGAFALEDEYHYLYGVGLDFVTSVVVYGADPDEYGLGGSQEQWTGYRYTQPLSGLYQINLYVNDTLYEVPNISADMLYGDVHGAIYPATYASVQCVSGSGTSGDPYIFVWSVPFHNQQPALEFVNQTAVVSNVYEIVEGGGADVGLITAIAT